MGFEPTKELPLYTLSRRAPSTTRPRLRVPVCATVSLLERVSSFCPTAAPLKRVGIFYATASLLERVGIFYATASLLERSGRQERGG